YTLGVEPSGRELLVVVIKGTFGLTESREDVRLQAEQLPLVTADSFTGEPGLSAPVDEADFAPRKRRCDFLLIGSAYAANAEPTPRIPVEVRIGEWRKGFSVIGDRQWSSTVSGIEPTPPIPLSKRSISYDVAFGGLDTFHEDPMQHAAFVRNPVGRGWH